VLPVLENGFLNLVAVVTFLIFAISIIPAVLYLGTPKRPSTLRPSSPEQRK
jgi:hypothetical protein